MNGFIITIVFMLLIAVLMLAIELLADKPVDGYKWDNNEYIDEDYSKLKNKKR